MLEDKILWQSGTSISHTFIQLLVVLGVVVFFFVILFGLFHAAYILSDKSYKGVWAFLIFAALPILIIALKISGYLNLIITAYTIEYYINTKGIFFEWGWMKKKHAYIDFKSITRVSLVNFKNKSYSTLYIEVDNPFSEPGVDFINGKSRHCPTMEKVVDGKKAFDLIQALRNQSNNS
ncbi:MAG: hypothetical protein R2730_16395 [Chitinophagales bacterium]